MGAVALIIQLVAKTFFLGLPVGVAWLAFRRLVMSETTNAWIYAGVGLFAAFSAAGLAPWALGFQAVSWLFLVFAIVCPPLWLATVIICGIGRSVAYEAPEHDAGAGNMRGPIYPDFPFDAAPKTADAVPLVLEKPIFPEPPKAVFRTHRSILREARHTVSARLSSKPDDRSLLEVARKMRGHKDTTRRRMPPLLPPPHAMSDLPNLPFLKG